MVTAQKMAQRCNRIRIDYASTTSLVADEVPSIGHVLFNPGDPLQIDAVQHLR